MFVLGNDIIHQISTSTMHKMSIYLEDFNRDFKYANYSYFEIGNEHRKYQLFVTFFKEQAEYVSNNHEYSYYYDLKTIDKQSLLLRVVPN